MDFRESAITEQMPRKRSSSKLSIIIVPVHSSNNILQIHIFLDYFKLIVNISK